jgi:hypothetical protein
MMLSAVCIYTDSWTLLHLELLSQDLAQKMPIGHLSPPSETNSVVLPTSNWRSTAKLRLHEARFMCKFQGERSPQSQLHQQGFWSGRWESNSTTITSVSLIERHLRSLPAQIRGISARSADRTVRSAQRRTAELQ